jgi:hypothetical protein
MNPFTHSKNSTILPLLTALALSAMTASASQNLPFRLGDEGTITFTGPEHGDDGRDGQCQPHG